jgi:hypothetical protein
VVHSDRPNCAYLNPIVDTTETQTNAAKVSCDVELVADELDELESGYPDNTEPELLV